jgi:hypothetical protein
MSDPYQLGSDLEWAKHTNEELTHLVKKRNAELNRLRFFCLVLILALGWVIYRFSRTRPLEELWSITREFQQMPVTKVIAQENACHRPEKCSRQNVAWEMSAYQHPADRNQRRQGKP